MFLRGLLVIDQVSNARHLVCICAQWRCQVEEQKRLAAVQAEGAADADMRRSKELAATARKAMQLMDNKEREGRELLAQAHTNLTLTASVTVTVSKLTVVQATARKEKHDALVRSIEGKGLLGNCQNIHCPVSNIINTQHLNATDW